MPFVISSLDGPKIVVVCGQTALLLLEVRRGVPLRLACQDLLDPGENGVGKVVSPEIL